ncbi:hypothetical protein K438DRAFT_1600930, partial [Mycena galopus ATCC 62051]
TESMEHILLECDAPGQRQIYRKPLEEKIHRLAQIKLWTSLGLGLARFRSRKSTVYPAKNRFFTILVSASMQLIWHLEAKNSRVISTGTAASTFKLHNLWLFAINTALKRDIILTNRARFGMLAIKKQLVLNTWSGALADEDALPDIGLIPRGFQWVYGPKLSDME